MIICAELDKVCRERDEARAQVKLISAIAEKWYTGTVEAQRKEAATAEWVQTLTNELSLLGCECPVCGNFRHWQYFKRRGSHYWYCADCDDPPSRARETEERCRHRLHNDDGLQSF